MSIKQTIMNDIKSAMKAQEKEKLATLRLITSSIKQIEVDTREELDDNGVMKVLSQMIKQRRESVKQFTQGDRMDLVEIEEKEITIIEAYLPQPLSEEELQAIVENSIKESGASSIKDMAKVISLVKPKLQPHTDMAKVSGLIKTLLNPA